MTIAERIEHVEALHAAIRERLAIVKRMIDGAETLPTGTRRREALAAIDREMAEIDRLDRSIDDSGFTQIARS